MSHSVDIYKTAHEAPLTDFPPSNDPQFQGFGGEITPIQLYLRLRHSHKNIAKRQLGMLENLYPVRMDEALTRMYKINTFSCIAATNFGTF
jgi:hypothetical protein